MPVLTPTALPNPGITYPILAILCSALLLIYLSRRKARNVYNHNTLPESEYQSSEIRTEKTPLPVVPQQPITAKPRIPFPIASSSPPLFPITITQQQQAASEYPFPPSPSSYLPSPSSPSFPIISETEEMGGNGIPRRRSYTRPLEDGPGGEISGEIVVAEGWRRHTRVFGGGVCKACEESERRMTA